MSLNFNVTKIKDYHTVTTAYRNHTTGAVYFEADTHIDHEDGDKKTFWVVENDSPAEVHEIWHPVTEAIVWRTMSVGLGTVTEDNVHEFYARSMLFDRITLTTPLWIEGKDTHITMKMLRDHIGLSTNVPDETRKKWIARIMDYEFRSVEGMAKREDKELETVA